MTHVQAPGSPSSDSTASFRRRGAPWSHPSSPPSPLGGQSLTLKAREEPNGSPRFDKTRPLRRVSYGSTDQPSSARSSSPSAMVRHSPSSSPSMNGNVLLASTVDGRKKGSLPSASDLSLPKGKATPPFGSPAPHFLRIDERGLSFPSSTVAQEGHHHLTDLENTTEHTRSTETSPVVSPRLRPSSVTTVNSSAPRHSPPTSVHTPPRRLTSDFSQPTAEDEASEHVRSVYAHLDQIGVPGDGYSDGVERTRERRGRDGRGGSPEVEMEKQKEALRLSTTEAGLGRKEEEVLRRTDRFGFFDESHKTAGGGMARVASLSPEGLAVLPPRSLPVRISKRKAKSTKPATAQSAAPPPSPTSPTLISAPAFASIKGERPTVNGGGPSEVALPSTSERQRETERIVKWAEMLQVSSRDIGHNISSYDLSPTFRSSSRLRKKFEKRCYKGIPDRWRSAAWSVLMRDFGRPGMWGVSWKDDLPMGSGDVPWTDKDAMGRRYRDAVETPSPQDVQIDLDVPRTISGNVYFHTRYGKGQRALFHVLHAWGLHCPECGYCQGMGSIAAAFLSYYDPESAYVCLLSLHDRYGLHSIFSPGFPGLVECFYLQERLIETLMPDVHQVFQSQMISSSAYATKWYITLFATTIPFHSQLRLWDVFLLEGKDVLVIAAVSIVWSFRERLCSDAASFETILSLLSCYFVIDDDDTWMRWIRKVAKRKDVRRMMAGWRKEWKGFVEDGSAAGRMT